MQPLKTFYVIPKLPVELEPLRELVMNLWWTWEPSARKLFRQIDIDLWDRTNHNPLRVLQLCRQARLIELADDKKFIEELGAIYAKFQAYLSKEDTYASKREDGLKDRGPVAYFSAEFGFHESVPNYSGGLGILAGDHCKSASDLGLNFVGVGLLYRHGYFKQQINRDGWQEAVNLNQNFAHLPVTEVRIDGQPLRVGTQIRGEHVVSRVWELKVGRVKLYLLDTDIAENSQANRLITAELYGGDLEMRIKQEIILGIGGVQALRAMGITPSVFHMNEGHAAFLGLERIRREVHDHGLDFYSALQVVAASNVFTTHTPVPAGNDAFSRDLMFKYFADYPQKVGIDFDTLMSFGQFRLTASEPFSMTILALRTSRHSNGVSALHGEVSRSLWKDVWLEVPLHEVPITSVTNGIHTKTWLAPEFHALYEKYLGPDWAEHLTDREFWRRVIEIPDEELWQTHMLLKSRLVEFVRERLRRRAVRLGESPETIRRINHYLDPDVFTIGFARRFATYKRGNLIFADPGRLLRLLSNTERPVQIIFAGKAHPADEQGKKIIQEVVSYTQKEGFEGRIVFIEDYDAYIGRRLYQGVDLWLNNPIRPLEASGTSGMKVPPNGGLNLSVLDGWWPEAWNHKNGWAIGPEISGGPVEFQNQVDISSLYSLLENQITPLFYAKPDGRLPVAWIQLMRESMRSIVPMFNTHRMVMEYNDRLYEPSARAHAALAANNAAPAVELARWKSSIRQDWPQIRILKVSHDRPESSNLFVGESLEVTARVQLGSIAPDHVRVQVYAGFSENNHIEHPCAIDLNYVGTENTGIYIYKGTLAAPESGSYGFSVRVIPTHINLIQAHELRLITWANE